MNSYQFEESLVSIHEKVNIITKSEDGYYVKSRSSRTCNNDLKYYSTLSRAKKYSKSYNPTYKSVIVEKNGNDFANATITNA